MSLAAFALVLLAAPPQPATFSAGVRAVYVDAFVRDDDGPVTGLTAADFALTDDGVRQEIELVAVETFPLTTVLVLDTSGSIDDTKLRHLQAAGRAFLGGLRPGDEMALVTFNEEVRLRVPPTQDTARLERALNGVLPRGATSLYDALFVGTTLASRRGRSLLVVFTDGADNASWLDASQVAQVVEESDVLVQIVTTTPPSQFREGLEPYLRYLRQLAESTGGEVWRAESSAKLASSFQAVLDAMQTRYVLRFEPRGPVKPGRHRLEMKLTRRGAKVQCRRAYFVAPPE